MDIQRPVCGAAKEARRIAFGVASVVILGVVSVTLPSEAAAPTVERATVWSIP